jgi:hypothetical protein
MHTKATIEPRGSPVGGIMPEPVRVHADRAATPRRDDPAGDRHDQTDVVVRRRDPVRIVLAKVLSVIRGDKYMVDAYEPAWSARGARRAAATVVGANHNGDVGGDVGAAAHSVAASKPAVAAAAGGGRDDGRTHRQRTVVLDNAAASPPKER